ncbi:DUF4913 domain-containing protein [Nocardia cyriacigeorgica]|uniref:DUF4913 domain-containing protein n=1 Tax=Nocardia cyriacigeorgica TaxID=135487 RepID=UPI0018945B04|nr:DUF4913 domain-containing protein [Nocardia cyriacigeorgica]MBF6439686.1 DUF4913 domain-containing protein [Nocardia cyriacigeorgica]
MTAPPVSGSGAGGAKSKAAPKPPQYAHFTDFVTTWLLPTINVRLAEANRENTYTWCERWWAHRTVAVRFAHLHAAFEAQRRSSTGSSLSTFLLSHVDAHLKVILDAANGPLHRCTRREHVSTASLPFDPVPPGWFGPPKTPSPEPNPTGGDRGEGAAGVKTPPRFAHYSQFVQKWLLPVTSVRIAANQREGQYTWCRQWWRHQAVVVRFAAVHRVFEAALRADDKTAMSTLFVRHIDPHMRYILDAANGPLYRCTPDDHLDTPGLPTAPVPDNWFGVPGATTPIEHLGFGPDYRDLRQPADTEGES